MSIHSRPVTVDDVADKNCWICAETEDEDTAEGEGEPFVHPCGCTLVAHESCLMRWIDTQQKTSAHGRNLMGMGGNGRAGGEDPHFFTTACCPQCRQTYQMIDPASTPERWLRNVLSTIADKVVSSTSLAVGASVGAGAYVLCAMYGRLATRMLVGRSLADRVFNRPWAWHLYADVPLLPFVLVLMRLPILLSPSYWVLPTLLMLPFVQNSAITPGVRPGVDGFTRRLLRGSIGSFASRPSRSGLWPPTPASTLLLIPWARLAYFPLRRAVYRLLFRSWYRAEAERRQAMVDMPRPRPSAARTMMDMDDDAQVEEDAPDHVLGDDDVQEVLHMSQERDQTVYLTSSSRIHREYRLAVQQPPALASDSDPTSASAEHGREPYVDPGIAAEDVTYKNWERRTLVYTATSQGQRDARQMLQMLDTMSHDEEHATDAQRRVAASIQRTREMLGSTSGPRRPVLRVELFQMDEVHHLYVTPASVLGLIFGSLTLPLFAAAGGSLLLYISNFAPPLRRFLGLSPKGLALGSATFGSALLGSGLGSSPAPRSPDSNEWSVWDTLTGEDPVWWRNALGAALWIASRDLAVATLRLLRFRARRTRHLKSLPFAPSQLETLTLRPGRRSQITAETALTPPSSPSARRLA